MKLEHSPGVRGAAPPHRTGTRAPADDVVQPYASRGARTTATVAMHLQRTAGNRATGQALADHQSVQRMAAKVNRPGAELNFQGGHIEGHVGLAFTDRGTPVRVWSASPGNDPDHLYFCHGLTLGTYHQHHYSVFSGADVLKALIDEHLPLATNFALLQQGDIIGWRDAVGNVNHTALVVNLPVAHRTRHNILLWTKNGFAPEQAGVSLHTVCGTYGNNYRFWR